MPARCDPGMAAAGSDSAAPASEGRLFYLVGEADCCGDERIESVRRRLADSERIAFAHRYVTGGTSAMSDVALSEGEFALRKRLRLFALDWESRGARYGVGNEINFWLAMGLSVVVPGSRDHIAAALVAYPDMVVVWMIPAAGVQSGPLDAEGARTRAGAPRAVIHVTGGNALSPEGRRLISALDAAGGWAGG